MFATPLNDFLAIHPMTTFPTLDAWLTHLESAHPVGIDGGLDAVNILDTDCAIITSIDIDHTEYLGDTREKIALEKAGIFRPGKPAICADPVPPQTLIDHAEQIGAELWLFGRDFRY